MVEMNGKNLRDKKLTELKEKIMEFLDGFEKRYFAVITIDRSYNE